MALQLIYVNTGMKDPPCDTLSTLFDPLTPIVNVNTFFLIYYFF